MPKIAISYRRADSKAITGRIFDRLTQHYGENEIFIDIDHIPYGSDFRTAIDRTLRQADVLIAVVGTQWRGAGGGEPARIFDETDPVRVELQTALAVPLRIIPVLVDGARMPQASELPDSLKEFACRNALTIDSGVDFKLHIGRLIRVLDQMLGIPPAASGDEAAASDPHPGLSTGAGAGKSIALWLRVVVGYLLVPAILLALTHYLALFKLNVSTSYLRLAAIVVPMVTGFLLARLERRGLAIAVLLGTGCAVLTVGAMQTITAMIDGTTIMPSTAQDWQQAIEFLVSITLSTVVGSLVARAMSSARRPNTWWIRS